MRSSAHATNSAAQKSGGARKSERVDMRTSSHASRPVRSGGQACLRHRKKTDSKCAGWEWGPQPRKQRRPWRTLKRNSDAFTELPQPLDELHHRPRIALAVIEQVLAHAI